MPNCLFQLRPKRTCDDTNVTSVALGVGLLRGNRLKQSQSEGAGGSVHSCVTGHSTIRNGAVPRVVSQLASLPAAPWHLGPFRDVSGFRLGAVTGAVTPLLCRMLWTAAHLLNSQTQSRSVCEWKVLSFCKMYTFFRGVSGWGGILHNCPDWELNSGHFSTGKPPATIRVMLNSFLMLTEIVQKFAREMLFHCCRPLNMCLLFSLAHCLI